MASGAAARPADIQGYYDRLMSFTLRHDFYDGGVCPDFTITATPPTDTLLRNLGMIARPRRGSLDILYHTAKSAGIVRYLCESRDRRAARQEREQKADEKAKRQSLNRLQTHFGSWNRLTFLLTANDELFSNFTDMPLDKGIGEQSLQVSNQFAVQPVHHPVRLEVDWSKHSLRILAGKLSPHHLCFPTSVDAERFVLYDTSGRAILHADPLYQPPADAAAAMAEVPRRMRLTPPIDVHVDMANEFPGSFSYRIDNKALSPVPATDIEFFYPGASQRPLLFVDLYLASPEKSWAQSQGCYPITLPETRPEAPKDDATLAAANAEAQRHIKALDYEIRFAARETIWIYYVVLSAGLAADEELAIRSEPPERLAFVKDPTPAPLPGGAIAHRFVATKAQPLRRRPDITPRLLAAARANGATRVLLERLPTPSVKQIIAQRAAASTGPPAAATAASEVFVYL